MEINCNQCGGSVPIRHDTGFLACPFCETALYVDVDRTVKHFAMTPQVTRADLAPTIRGRLASMEVVGEVEVEQASLLYFPFWRLLTPAGRAVCLPAAAPPIEELQSVEVPAGALSLFDPALAERHPLVQPVVPLEDADVQARALLGGADVTFEAASMVHVPFFDVRYRCQDASHTCWVGAASKDVVADDWPSAAEQHKDKVLGRIALLTFALFFAEALVLPGLWTVLLLYALTAAGMCFVARRALHRMGW